MINLPVNITLNYVAENDYPVSTVTSTHFIQDMNDVDVMASFMNVFSSETFTNFDVIDLISASLKDQV